MKMFSNPARIGDAALAHLFKPFRTKRYERTLTISKEEVNLFTLFFDAQTSRYLCLWGISPGLQKMEIGKFETVLANELIAKNIKTQEHLEQFSHIVVISESSSKAPCVHNDRQDVHVFRLTIYHKAIIDCTRDWITLGA